MSILYVDGKRMRRSILAALKWLVAKQEVLNKLNVYPVPDGDTGTNMVLTMRSAAESMEKSPTGRDNQPTGQRGEGDLSALTRRLAGGALMGARGNSGVILSQIIRGFADGLADKPRMDSRELSGSFQEAVRRAYAAMENPVEGTILTVLRESADAAAKVAETDPDIVHYLETMHDEALLSLERTPEKLPVLKEAGVVDSGAMGFVCIIEGIMRLIRGEELDANPSALAAEVAGPVLEGSAGGPPDIGPRFCTEFLLHCGADVRGPMREFLQGRGESLIFVADGDVVRVHIHTDEPAEVLRHARGLGEVSHEKVDDMQVQHGHLLGEARSATAPAAAVGLVATAPGDGFARILRSLGVAGIVAGGDTSNPSVEEILRAAGAVDAERLIFLPNNRNIILAGEQAARASQQGTGRPISLVRTKSVIQGIAAAVAFDPDAPVEESVESMRAAMQEVKTIAVCRAKRDSSFKGMKIGKGEYFSLLDGEPLKSCPDLNETAVESIKSAREDEDMLALYFGADVTEKDAAALAEHIGSECGDLQVEVHEGRQPHYQYYVSLE